MRTQAEISLSSVRQRGVVLFIALIVLVAMSLAAVALTRSADTANIVAGNQAFKQGALSSTDIGVAAAMAEFNTTPAGTLSSDTNTHTSAAANCYKAVTFSPGEMDYRGVPRLLLDPTAIQAPFLAAFDTTYSACQVAGVTGEIVRYIIDRQCDPTMEGLAANNTNCGSVSTTTPARTDNDKHTGSETVPMYRVTVRVDGPRHAASYTQTILRP